VVEAWSRRAPVEAVHLAHLRLPHVTADDQTATELVVADAASSALAEFLEHGPADSPEPGTAEAMATAFTTAITSLDAKRGWGAEVRSPSLEALVGDTPLGSGPWLGQLRRFAAHLQTTEVRARLSRG
jgi:hypothetical protein